MNAWLKGYRPVLLIGFTHHGVDTADDGDDVGYHRPLGHVLESLKIRRRRAADFELPGMPCAIADDVEA